MITLRVPMPRRGEQGRKPQSKAGAEAIGVAQADNQGALLSLSCVYVPEPASRPAENRKTLFVQN